MFDTIVLYLPLQSCGGVDVLQEVPPRLATREYLNDKQGNLLVKGKYKNLDILTSSQGVRLEGSFSRCLFDDNINSILPNELEALINNISNYLGLPLLDSFVYRFDVSKSIETERPPLEYIQLFDNIRAQYFKRIELQEKGLTTLYYKSKTEEFYFYDKMQEIRANKSYQGTEIVNKEANILRVEQRYFKRVGSRILGAGSLQLKDLTDENIYKNIVNKFIKRYKQINKKAMNKNTFSLSEAIKEFEPNEIGTAYLLNEYGSEKIIQAIKENEKAGALSRSTAYRRIKAVKNVIAKFNNMNLDNDNTKMIQELDNKILSI